MSLARQLKFDRDGLIPAIVRDAVSGEVLMLSYLNAEAVEQTLATGLLHRYSRSAGKLISPPPGAAQRVREARLSCVDDCLLLRVDQEGEGPEYFKTLLWRDETPDDRAEASMPEDILAAIYRVIQKRRANPSEKSYVASLYAKGLDKILGKIGEEATETAVAGKGGDVEAVVYETADLFFHVLVLLGYYELPPERIYAELRRRFGLSGIEEKAGRESASEAGTK
jgi:phosphoribosyl-ATP pyrophosphohydrolase/phosphoribosyl-AMP cyclohydrolase